MEELSSYPGFVTGKLFVKKGDYSKRRRVGNDASGWVQVRGIDQNDTLNKMYDIYHNFSIQVKEKDGIKYVKKV